MSASVIPHLHLRAFGRRSIAALALAAAALGTLALAPSATAAPLPASSYHGRTSAESKMALAVEKMINAERRAHGLPRLYMRKTLMLSARRHDFTMARYDEMSHQVQGEPVFTSRIRSAGYKWKWAGENIAWNSQMTTAGVQQLESMMYNERAPYDEHRLNILNTHYKNVGVDVYLDSTHKRVWLTTDFGSH